LGHRGGERKTVDQRNLSGLGRFVIAEARG
jgi:hypothetical protein